LSYEFTDGYVSGLRDRNTEIQNHFAAHFSRELDAWLRSRLRDRSAIEDLRQETLRRVLQAVIHGSVLRDANRLPQFVNGICRNVLLEYWRTAGRTGESGECPVDLDEIAAPEERSHAFEQIGRLEIALMKLPAEDLAVLRMLYYDELDRSEISRRVGINRGNLRVRVHRAISRLRASFV